MTREQILQDVKLYLSQDWEVIDETTEYFKLKRNKATLGGHILIFLFLGWWTFGLANLIYHFSKRKIKKIFK